MSFTLASEQRELSDTARRVLADRVGRLPQAWDAVGSGLDRELWRSVAELGRLGLGVAAERGGSGGEVRELCLAAEHVDAALPSIPFAGTAVVLATLTGDVGSIVDGDRIVPPGRETLPIAPSRENALRISRSTVDGSLRAVPLGMDADVLLACADDAPCSWI